MRILINSFGHIIRFDYGPSSSNPESDATIVTCDFTLWMKFDNEWIKPKHGFDQTQIEQMIHICKTEDQVLEIIKLLSK